ncbi:MAG: WecB/TagA/CpsF family glycosyltransferase [bacterium]|nr:WecB/TagA/CpsF family glycosyltransferase [bacterium]
MAKFDFLGLRFDDYSVSEAIEKIEEYIEQKIPRMVFTPNAELIVRASESQDLKEVYHKTDIVCVDSWVVYYFTKMKGHKLKEPASAANIMFRFLPKIAKKGYKVYLLGATNEVVKVVNQKLIKMNVNVVGFYDGYFDKGNPEEVVKDIKKSKADILFVAMSTPFKENFVSQNLATMNIPVSIGVGGSFDIIAGKCSHAPIWISKIGLEWFYRFMQEPRRMWYRYLVTNTKFLLLYFFKS